MTQPQSILIDEERTIAAEARFEGATVRLSPETLRSAIGWELTPEGLCKGADCVPVREREHLVRDGDVDPAQFAALLARPLAIDAEERFACLGASAEERSQRLASLEAPDFTLPDLDGRLHSLSDYRGKKVLLVAYASW